MLEWLKVNIEIASLDSAEPQCNAHLRLEDFFAADTFPMITFESTSIEQATTDRFVLKDPLNMHGVSHTLEFILTITSLLRDPSGNLRVGAQAQRALRRKD